MYLAKIKEILRILIIAVVFYYIFPNHFYEKNFSTFKVNLFTKKNNGNLS